MKKGIFLCSVFFGILGVLTGKWIMRAYPAFHLGKAGKASLIFCGVILFILILRILWIKLGFRYEGDGWFSRTQVFHLKK